MAQNVKKSITPQDEVRSGIKTSMRAEKVRKADVKSEKNHECPDRTATDISIKSESRKRKSRGVESSPNITFSACSDFSKYDEGTCSPF